MMHKMLLTLNLLFLARFLCYFLKQYTMDLLEFFFYSKEKNEYAENLDSI